MSQAAFTTACHRVRAVISHSPLTHHVVALVLGVKPSEFRLMEARNEFPWGHFAAFVRRFPELGIDLDQFPETAIASIPEGYAASMPEACAANIPAVCKPISFPDFEELAAFMDTDMARMGVTQPTADAWGAAA